jgi:hypothetical protein
MHEPNPSSWKQPCILLTNSLHASAMISRVKTDTYAFLAQWPRAKTVLRKPRRNSGSGGGDPLILNVDTRETSLVSFTSQPLHTHKKHIPTATGVTVALRAYLDILEKKECLPFAPTGNQAAIPRFSSNWATLTPVIDRVTRQATYV